MNQATITTVRDRAQPLRRLRLPRATPLRRVVGLLGSVFLLGLALLPLSALLLIVPAVFAQESVLVDTVRPARSRARDIGRRVASLLTGIALLIAMLAFAVEVVSWFNLKPTYFGKLSRDNLPQSLIENLPVPMIEQWPYVLLLIYATDVLFLLAIGKVPIQYNLRNLGVRWRTTLLTGLAFTVVVCLLTIMLSFLVGLNNMTATSGVPGNVFILSEGSTDELFSTFYKEQSDNILNQHTEVDPDGRPLATPVRIKEIPGPGGSGKVKLCSFETYFVINQEVPAKAGERPRRRLVQLRGIQDAYVASKVHNVELLEGTWFGSEGAQDVGGDKTACPAVLGEGAASKFAEDLGKPKLKVGDRFTLGGLDMVVAGIMKTEGTTFGSEIWATWKRVSDQFHKPQYTTVVLRASDDSEAGAKALAAHLSKNYNTPRVRAIDEPRYYEDLSKSNQQLLSAVIFIVIIMAIGGVFSVMNTMFAAIAQRIRDIGVLRILGFKRWQILVSFLLETLGIAMIGGLLGLLLGSFADGFQMTSNISSGMGSGKTVILRMVVDSNVLICGLLLTIVMGRIGGLVPALSAMRLGILDSLK